MIPPLFLAMIPSLEPACTATAMRGKLGSVALCRLSAIPQMLVVALVHSRLDCGTGVLVGWHDTESPTSS